MKKSGPRPRRVEHKAFERIVCEHDFVTVPRKGRYLAQCRKCKFYIKEGQKRKYMRTA